MAHPMFSSVDANTMTPERLRREAGWLDDGSWVSRRVTSRLLREAADEIERLRASLTQPSEAGK